MGYKLKPTKKSSKKKYSFTTTSDGKRICQTARAKEAWIDATRKKLYSGRSKEERKVYEWLPPVLRKQAECQYVIEYQSHVYFADIYLKRLKIAIEVDGEFHYSSAQIEKDKIRETHFAKKGIKTMRIRNEDVNTNAKLWEFIQSLMQLHIAARPNPSSWA